MTKEELIMQQKNVAVDLEAAKADLQITYESIFDKEDTIDSLEEINSDLLKAITDFVDPVPTNGTKGKSVLDLLSKLGASLNSPFNLDESQQLQFSVTYYEGVPYWITIKQRSAGSHDNPKNILVSYGSSYKWKEGKRPAGVSLSDNQRLPLTYAPNTGDTFADFVPEIDKRVQFVPDTRRNLEQAVTISYNNKGEAYDVWWRTATPPKDIIKITHDWGYRQRKVTLIQNPFN
jgi:hypothetical protein